MASRVAITGKVVWLAAYHRQMDFSRGCPWLVVLKECLGSASAVYQSPTAFPRTNHGQTKIDQKITTYDHVHQIFVTVCT